MIRVFETRTSLDAMYKSMKRHSAGRLTQSRDLSPSKPQQSPARPAASIQPLRCITKRNACQGDATGGGDLGDYPTCSVSAASPRRARSLPPTLACPSEEGHFLRPRVEE